MMTLRRASPKLYNPKPFARYKHIHQVCTMLLLGAARLGTYYAAWICGCFSLPVAVLSAAFGILWPVYVVLAYYSFRCTVPAAVLPAFFRRLNLRTRMDMSAGSSSRPPIGRSLRLPSTSTLRPIVTRRSSYLKRAQRLLNRIQK